MMRKLLALFVSALLLSSCGQGAVQGDQTGFVSADGSAVLRDPGQRGEPLTLHAQLLDGTKWRLEDLRGQVVLINAWGPWCAPCRVELPVLQKLSDDYSARGLAVVGFATRTNAASVTAFTQSSGITYPQVADYDSAVMARIGGVPSATIPSTLLIDRTGRVAGWVLGEFDKALMRSLVDQVLEEK